MLKSTMSTEDLEIYGINPKSIEKVHDDVNTSKQSSLREIGENVLITRPLSKEFTGKSSKEELKRRKEAVQLHQKEIPQYTLHKDHVVLQGINNAEDQKESVPVLGRFLEKIKDVKKVTELSTKEVLSDEELCKALTTINAFQLKQLIRNSILVDQGKRGDNSSTLISKFASHLTSDNVFVGRDKKGERKIFCDPDWYIDLENDLDGIKTKILHGSRLLVRTGFFYGVTKYHQTKNVFKPKEKTEVRIQKQRATKKAHG